MASVSEALQTVVLVAIVALLVKVFGLGEIALAGFDLVSLVFQIVLVYAAIAAVRGLIDEVRALVGK